jgi:hypothetical protein
MAGFRLGDKSSGGMRFGGTVYFAGHEYIIRR